MALRVAGFKFEIGSLWSFGFDGCLVIGRGVYGGSRGVGRGEGLRLYGCGGLKLV